MKERNFELDIKQMCGPIKYPPSTLTTLLLVYAMVTFLTLPPITKYY